LLFPDTERTDEIEKTAQLFAEKIIKANLQVGLIFLEYSKTK